MNHAAASSPDFPELPKSKKARAHNDTASGYIVPRPRFEDLPDVLVFEDLYAFLPIGRDNLYIALRNQEIRNVRRGQKFLIPKDALRDFLGGVIAESSEATPRPGPISEEAP
jgi:hypothetical protein